jgi:hypothetical protein
MDYLDAPDPLDAAERSLQEGHGQKAIEIASSMLKPGALASDVNRALYVLLQSDYMAGR